MFHFHLLFINSLYCNNEFIFAPFARFYHIYIYSVGLYVHYVVPVALRSLLVSKTKLKLQAICAKISQLIHDNAYETCAN